ncbi:MAG: carbamate kinase [Tissierellaceae bacterium]|nr:carbamate kinase [Tissierellaceae bacterium]
MSKILVALGGNALGNNPKEQYDIAKESAKAIVDLVEQGHEIVVAHGNGPQVGMINLAMEDVNMPFPECVAMSQGYIGYHLQNRILEELNKRNITKNVSTIITQVVVEENDKAFDNPTKPIGKFYMREEAAVIEREKGYIMIEDSGRGYRRVVPSPKPIDVVEKESIKALVEKGHIVITVGGGGIPVIKDKLGYRGIDGVIDKDLASAKIADLLDMDYLFILTAVPMVSINFGKENEIGLDKMSVGEAKAYMENNQFAKGSMLPKVMAAVEFVQSKKERKSVIASLYEAEKALKGNSGTIIYKD